MWVKEFVRGGVGWAKREKMAADIGFGEGDGGYIGFCYWWWWCCCYIAGYLQPGEGEKKKVGEVWI